MNVTNQIAYQAIQKNQPNSFKNTREKLYSRRQSQINMSSKSNLVSFKGDLFSREKKGITNIKNNKLKKPLFAIMALVTILGVGSIVSCHDDDNDTYNDITYTPNEDTVSPEKLSPQEFVQQYTAAWRECYKEVPEVDPNLFMTEEGNRLSIEHDKKVEALIKEEYPEIYAYKQYPEYNDELTREAQEQIQQILDNGQQEIDQEQQEIDSQAQRDTRELENQKEKSERWLKDNSAPDYVP